MGKRRRGREGAVQCLYQWDMIGRDPEEVLERIRAGAAVPLAAMPFCERLFRGTVRHVDEIDALLAEQARHWRLDRMGKVERGILRLGVYELLYEDETPDAVVIDEAIELTKRYCAAEAAQFVNGVLDGVRLRLRQDGAEAASASPVTTESNG